jgi:hypothetical protein
VGKARILPEGKSENLTKGKARSLPVVNVRSQLWVRPGAYLRVGLRA